MVELSYPSKLDDNIVRAVASITFAVSLTMILRPQMGFLIIPLALDFGLRLIHPKISPLARLTKYFCQKVLGKSPDMIYAPPKRFAVLIGMMLTFSMSILYFLSFSVPFLILNYFLLIASGLQSWFDYCIGCKIYDILVGYKILGRSKSVDSFLNYLETLEGDSVDLPNNTEMATTNPAVNETSKSVQKKSGKEDNKHDDHMVYCIVR